jgi:type IV secretion system protein VirB8
MFRKKETTPKVEGAVAKAVNYEVTIADIARRSERRAWMVAFAAIAMSLILAGGYFYMLPLKEKVPFLVMADAYTGTAAVARLDESFRNRWVTSSEAINRSNVAHYVTMRESFDDAMMHLRDWRAVHSMSSPAVGGAYSALHSSKNPNSPLSTYGKSKAVRARILSIVFIGGEGGTTPKGATVRFQRSLYDKANGASKPMDSKIATLEFTYNLNLKMDEKDRIENPLGFQVTSYRVDNDYAASPPLEPEIVPLGFDDSAPLQQQGSATSVASPGADAATLQPAAGAGAAPPTGSAAPHAAQPAPAASDTANGATNR